MEIFHNVINDIYIFKPTGDLAFEDVKIVKDYIQNLLNEDPKKGAILNLEEIRYLDSTGVGLIVSIYIGLKKLNSHFTLCNLNKAIAKTFNMVLLDQVLKIYETEEEAIASFQ